MNYDPASWFWNVAGDTSRVWSSAANVFVAATDGAYLAWVEGGGVATAIDSMDSLIAVLREAGVPPYHSIATSTLVERLDAIGKADASDEFMATHKPLRRRFYTVGRFFADDASLVAMIAGIGADASVVLAPEQIG